MRLLLIALIALFSFSLNAATCSNVYKKIKDRCDVRFYQGMHTRIKASNNICQQVGKIQFVYRTRAEKLYVIDLDDCASKSQRGKSFKVYYTDNATVGFIPRMMKYLFIEDGRVFAMGSRNNDYTLFELMNTSRGSYSTITGASYDNYDLTLHRHSRRYPISYNQLKVGKRLQVVSKHERRADKAGVRAMEDMGMRIQ